MKNTNATTVAISAVMSLLISTSSFAQSTSRPVEDVTQNRRSAKAQPTTAVSVGTSAITQWPTRPAHPTGPVAIHSPSSSSTAIPRFEKRANVNTVNSRAQTVKTIIQFSAPADPSETESARAKLAQTLGSISQGAIKLTDSTDPQNQATPCKTGFCVFVTNEELRTIEANQNSLAGYKAIGEKIHVDYAAAPKPDDRDPGGAGIIPWTETTKVFGGATPSGTYFDDFNNNYHMEAGAWFPNPSTVTNTAMIDTIYYTYGFDHSNPSDLEISVGIDDTALGGNTNVSEFVWDNKFGFGGYRTVTGQTRTFYGYHPDTYYYIHAWDNTAGHDDWNYLDFADFQVFWIDYPNLEVYQKNNTMLNDKYYDTVAATLDLTTTVVNTAKVDAQDNKGKDIPFDIAWYLTKVANQNVDCSKITNLSTNDYFVGFSTVNSLNKNIPNTANLNGVQLDYVVNAQQQNMKTGYYCLWAFIDDTDKIIEGWEDDNVWIDESAYQNENRTGKFPIYFEELQVGVKPIIRKEAGMKIWPNPVKPEQSQITIDLLLSVQFGNIQYTIVDINGQVVRQGQESVDQRLEVNVNNLAPGLYFITVQKGTTTVSSKFTKL